jgi:hypothetical protein
VASEPFSLNSLGSEAPFVLPEAAGTLCERSESTPDLDRAIRFARMPVCTTAQGHTNQATGLDDFGTVLDTRFEPMFSAGDPHQQLLFHARPGISSSHNMGEPPWTMFSSTSYLVEPPDSPTQGYSSTSSVGFPGNIAADFIEPVSEGFPIDDTGHLRFRTALNNGNLNESSSRLPVVLIIL